MPRTAAAARAYLAAFTGGLHILDVSDPNNVSLIGSAASGDRARGVTVSGEYAYVADSQNGLVLFDIADPTVPLIIDTAAPALSVRYKEVAPATGQARGSSRA